MKTMSKRLIIGGCLVSMLSFASCENKRDDNGDFGGMWQLTEWRDPSNNTIATNSSGIYYKVRKQLIQFQRLPGGQANFQSAYFRFTNDSLCIYHIVNYPSDTLCTPEILAPFGFPPNGRLHVDALSSKKMVLSSQETGTLHFRKY